MSRYDFERPLQTRGETTPKTEVHPPPFGLPPPCPSVAQRLCPSVAQRLAKTLRSRPRPTVLAVCAVIVVVSLLVTSSPPSPVHPALVIAYRQALRAQGAVTARQQGTLDVIRSTEAGLSPHPRPSPSLTPASGKAVPTEAAPSRITSTGPPGKTEDDSTQFLPAQVVGTNGSFLPCGWTLDAFLEEKTRLRAVLRCNRTFAGIAYERVSQNLGPTTLVTSDAETTSCLKRVIQSRQCTDAGVGVPRVAHYVWFAPARDMSLHFFVGVLSVVRFLRPCLVLFHGDDTPKGPFWTALLHLVPRVMHAPRSRPSHIFGNSINLVEHSADVTRLRVLIKYGGLYADTDQFLLRPVDDLRRHLVTLGLEVAGSKCGNGLILAEPGAEFLRLWLNSYASFDDSQWSTHSTVLPYNLSQSSPHLVTLVDSFFRPNYKDIEPLYKGRGFDWGSLYALHLYYRFYYEYFETLTRLDSHNSTIGDMTRHILFGSKTACFDDAVVKQASKDHEDKT